MEDDLGWNLAMLRNDEWEANTHLQNSRTYLTIQIHVALTPIITSATFYKLCVRSMNFNTNYDTSLGKLF
jgi:hypothetical protein